MDIEKDMTSLRKPVKASYSDKLFLLNFVMSTYLGPDVYSDNPRCSSFQRFARRLPPYTSNNLGSSFLRVSQLESLYYYVLRNANSDLILKPNMFYMYLKGGLPLPSSGSVDDHRQFTSFFSLSLHEHKKYPSCEIIKGIVLIDDPVTSDMKKEDLERFKYLSGINDLRIDANECLGYHHGHQKGGDDHTESKCFINGDQENVETTSHGHENESAMFRVKYQRRRHGCDPFGSTSAARFEANGYAVRLPEQQEKLNSSTTDTVKMGVPPSEVNIVDIGESEEAYLFRVALPGVRTDFCEFSCDIKSNGEVQIEGSVTGGRIIRKRSRVFYMRIQQLWSAGPFSVSFNLPGPVDPRLFSPNFRNDGIFEGVVIKQK
ncbi:increased DNA methylation 3 [Euphorbia lathyris]|uniref:increased DNA methylation 3 n=1 Tax=Euphorbia lathyris TaxID=212925 RepID=UPI003313EE8E